MQLVEVWHDWQSPCISGSHDVGSEGGSGGGVYVVGSVGLYEGEVGEDIGAWSLDSFQDWTFEGLKLSGGGGGWDVSRIGAGFDSSPTASLKLCGFLLQSDELIANKKKESK